jgi:hypothetical protein
MGVVSPLNPFNAASVMTTIFDASQCVVVGRRDETGRGSFVRKYSAQPETRMGDALHGRRRPQDGAVAARSADVWRRPGHGFTVGAMGGSSRLDLVLD